MTKYEYAMAGARTYMMMARALQEKGIDATMYILRGIECCKLAQRLQAIEFEETIILKVA